MNTRTPTGIPSMRLVKDLLRKHMKYINTYPLPPSATLQPKIYIFN